MTIGFGRHYEVHVSNAAGAKALQAIGYTGSLDVCDGSMPIDDFIRGAKRALDSHQLEEPVCEVVGELLMLADEYKQRGETVMEWS